MAIEKKKCEFCGELFYGTAKAKVCSGKCRVAKHRANNKRRSEIL